MVQIWSRNTPKSGVNEPLVLHRVDLTDCTDLNVFKNQLSRKIAKLLFTFTNQNMYMTFFLVELTF